MPGLTVDPDDPGTVCVDVDDLFPPRLLGVVWHSDRDQSLAMSSFLEIAKDVCAAGPPPALSRVAIHRSST
jgi:DNA-binding transcriptional LysR family regulator